MKTIFRHWKILYAVCCLVYIGWVTHVGTSEFDRINGQYRVIVEQLDGDRIRAAALEELIAECRRKSRGVTGPGEDGCYSLSAAAVEVKEKEIEQRLIRARERGFTKVVLFYTFFVLIFLLGPPILVYLFIFGVLKLFKTIKIVR